MRAVIVGPHPGSTTGFVRVAVNVARQLMLRGWTVTYLATEGAVRRPAPNDLTTLVVEHIDDVAASLCAAIGSEPDGVVTEVVCFGNVWHSADVVTTLQDPSLRERVRLSVYVAVDYAPVAPSVRQLEERYDRVIPSTLFGVRTLEQWIRSDPPLPHGVDVGEFNRPCDEDRSNFRRAMFGLGDDDFLVTYFGRNSRHKRADLALRVFAHAVLGAASRCARCAHLTVHELDSKGSPSVPARACRSCNSNELGAEPPRHMQMYLHTDVAYRRMWFEGGGFDLPLLAQRLGITDTIRFADLARPDEGHSDADLVSLMSAGDVHLLLSEGGGWELTVLETAACGVANIVTDHAAPREYAGPFSMMIPPAYFHVDDWGCRAIADLDRATAALIELHDDPGLRAGLADQGPQVAAHYSWERVGELWHQRLLGGGAQ